MKQEPKSVRAVQTIAVIGYVVYLVAFITTIISFILSLSSGIALLASKDKMYNATQTLEEYIKAHTEGKITIYTLALFCFNASIISGGVIAVSFLAKRYFRHTMEVGTPFTHDGAKEMFRLGIIELIVTVGCVILTLILFGIFLGVFKDGNVRYAYLSYTGPIAGLLFIIFSYVLRYGADLREPLDK